MVKEWVLVWHYRTQQYEKCPRNCIYIKLGAVVIDRVSIEDFICVLTETEDDSLFSIFCTQKAN